MIVVNILELNYFISVVVNLFRTLLESWLTELCFGDDAAIMAPTRDNTVKAVVELGRVVRACGLNISIPKTKFPVAGRNITRSDLDPIPIGGGKSS